MHGSGRIPGVAVSLKSTFFFVFFEGIVVLAFVRERMTIAGYVVWQIDNRRKESMQCNQEIMGWQDFFCYQLRA
eukprot:scaffold261_cov58-Cyclotella_meneghiniana.AAC.3